MLTNLSFSEGRFLDVFKSGQVTLLLKKAWADDKNMANFWPIINMNTIEKILERLAQNQMRLHIQGSPNFSQLQSSYRTLHSTKMAMTIVVNNLLAATDNKTSSVLLSLDISAAFDTLDHHRLIESAKNLFELDEIVLEWLQSYLTGCTQYMSVGDCCSITVIMTSGVLQGLVPGLLLFSTLTAPVETLINSFGINYYQFANDTLYTIIDHDSSHCLESLTACADAVTGWHIWNILLLNPSKTEALVAGTRQQVAKLDTSNGIAVSGSIAPFSSKLRVLHVTMDEKLTFKDNIFRIVRACNYHLRTLRHIRLLVDQEIAHTFACLLVCTRLDYCNAIL